jgi:hypothetical protein
VLLGFLEAIENPPATRQEARLSSRNGRREFGNSPWDSDSKGLLSLNIKAAAL